MARNRAELIEENAELRAKVKELESGFRLNARVNMVENVGSIIRTFLRWGTAFGIAYIVYLMINSLAGKVTLAQVAINFLGTITITHTLAAAASAAGIAYGLQERRLRRQTSARLSNRIEDLEKRLDPNRSSSELTRQGTTNPLDESR